MSRSYVPPHYTVVGIQMMGRMFEQQVRIAQTLGAVALASNPLLSRRTATDGSDAVKIPHPASPTFTTPARRPRVQSARPQKMPQMAKRTHAMPV